MPGQTDPWRTTSTEKPLGGARLLGPENTNKGSSAVVNGDQVPLFIHDGRLLGSLPQLWRVGDPLARDAVLWCRYLFGLCFGWDDDLFGKEVGCFAPKSTSGASKIAFLSSGVNRRIGVVIRIFLGERRVGIS